MSLSVGILGATGYTGGELVRLLVRHPQVRITHITSERFVGRSFSEVHPHLLGALDLQCEAVDPQRLAATCEVVFCALPHLASMQVVPSLLDGGCRVIDLSADFRLKSAIDFQSWYGTPHTAADWLAQAVYGLPELYRQEIMASRLVANPGCYPTSVLLALTPFLRQGLIQTEGIVIDSKSGTSGAGRSPTQELLFSEVDGGFRPYKVVGHRHIAEIEQELGRQAEKPLQVRFTPHLLPQSRGILTTCYVRPTLGQEERDWQQVLTQFYADEPFVRVLPLGRWPTTGQVRGSNYCELGVALDPRTGWLVVISAIDNLVKGAAGQAVQNLNLLLGIGESLGLEQMPLYP
ncbi:MAG: N-acetyl-gamma-glutamyl-phosphate reductase [Magnetococcus sp. DMHC-6]